MRTLLIEDEPVASMMGSTLIRGLNCQCDTATTGQAALDLVNQNTYDFILCDLGLPDITGFEVVRQIRTGNGPNKDIPIFALTAHDDKESEDRAKKSGMKHLLKKPLNETTLKAALNCVDTKTC